MSKIYILYYIKKTLFHPSIKYAKTGLHKRSMTGICTTVQAAHGILCPASPPLGKPVKVNMR
jgi:hypothetical protein